MNRNMPSVRASTRELWFASAGGPRGPRRAAATRTATCSAVDDDVLDRQARLAAQPADEVAAQPARALARERGDDDLVDPLVAGTACAAAVNGSGCAIWPCASIPAPRSSASARAQPALGLGVARLARVALRADEQEAGRRLRRALADRAQQRLADDGLVRHHEHVRLAPGLARRGRSRRARRAATPAALRIWSTRFRRIQPERCCGCVETITSSGSSCAMRVAQGVHRIGVDDEPVRGDARRPAAPRACGRAGGPRRRGACPRRRRSPRAAR